MATSARLGFGVKLKMGDGGDPTEAFTDIGEIRGEFTFGEAVELVEATNHQSPANAAGNPYREYITGAEDGEEVTIPVNYDPTDGTHDNITGLRSKKGALVNFELHEPGNPNKASFSALVIGVSRSYPVDDIMQMEVTLKPTGAIVETVIA